jgi:hypothetical protein
MDFDAMMDLSGPSMDHDAFTSFINANATLDYSFGFPPLELDAPTAGDQSYLGGQPCLDLNKDDPECWDQLGLWKSTDLSKTHSNDAFNPSIFSLLQHHNFDPSLSCSQDVQGTVMLISTTHQVDLPAHRFKPHQRTWLKTYQGRNQTLP